MADTFRVIRGTSTRADPDPASDRHDEWVHWSPGDTVKSFPPHTPVAELVESGAWEPVKNARKEAE